MIKVERQEAGPQTVAYLTSRQSRPGLQRQSQQCSMGSLLPLAHRRHLLPRVERLDLASGA